MRPKSIVRFEILYLGALLIGLINTFVTWDATMAQVNADPNARMLGSGFVIGSLVVSYAISLTLWYFTARRASNIAKWILVVFFVLGTLGVVFPLMQGQFPQGLGGVLAIAGWVMQTAAVVMLFQRDAAAWFRGEPAGDPAVPFE